LGGGQVSVISQSGGLGFACFDRARPRHFLFRHIVTTGNEAALEVADFVDYMLDEGKTEVFVLLIEAIKTPAKFKRVAEKALQAGKTADRRQNRPERTRSPRGHVSYGGASRSRSGL
jgi:acyl-CoA synthetase (NDP forming)